MLWPSLEQSQGDSSNDGWQQTFIRSNMEKSIPKLSPLLLLIWSTLRPVQTNIRPRGYKTFFMLSSVEHEILNAHKYKNINKFSFF